MSTESCCSSGINLWCDWVIPEGIIHRKLGDFYRDSPVMSRVAFTPIALISGILKPFFFPLICAVGVVVQPIIALVHAWRGEKEWKKWLQAFCFSFIGLVASIAILGIAIYFLPLVATVAILVTLIALSITIHVYKLVKEPTPTH